MPDSNENSLNSETVIAHISDLHISNNAFDDEIFLEVVNQINDLCPDMVIVTGDLTDHGYYSEFLKAKEYFSMIQFPLFAVPGNHDARNVGYEIFEELIGERSWVLTKDDDLTVIGMDSSGPDIDRGHIGRPQQLWMENELNKSLKNSNFSIVAMHHHVIPVPKTGRERNVLSDAGDILQSLIDHDVNMVICGHKHVPHLWRMENTLFVNAGSVSSIKLRGKDKNSYNTYHIRPDHIDVILNNINDEKIFLGKFNRI
ncbi:putative phosphohydrolase [Methanobrevibacter arboriphilus JCM 13429 = DSM 1125]|uniref:Putative phosphohydrolase n=1 Tax=Methanobrevibacter arboriphilus JCM 13429 = DSM 1125 TaxID=1300164 RepID=A0A1V6N2C1_METAZ|nr:metallophosphoesterase [Methanobrevibacter arboriphilus]OQD58848.1 putative phosphohydrolase [Methanobrevibacter arboriphilus JCM 13429 = DSM 1125]